MEEGGTVCDGPCFDTELRLSMSYIIRDNQWMKEVYESVQHSTFLVDKEEM